VDSGIHEWIHYVDWVEWLSTLAIFATSQEVDRQGGATARIAHRAMVAQGTPCCGHCGRKGYDKLTCWKLHPELRRERSKAGYER
jgi:hypothetical protein